MQVNITARHFEVTDGIKQHIEEKIGKLEKYSQDIVQAHVILEIQKYRHIAEITVLAKKIKLTATATAEDMYSAIDLVIHNLEEQVRKHKDKVRGHPHRDAQPLTAETAQKVVAEMPFVERLDIDIKPMHLEDAVDVLKTLKDDFMVFYNLRTKRPNIICRRKGGTFGLIEL